MSLITRPWPGLFGGVSQQIPAMRHPTQCEDQENMVATTVDGLYTRPGTQHIATLPLTGPNSASVADSFGDVFAHTVTRAGGQLYDLTIVDDNLMLYNTRTGAVQTVAFPDGKAYLATTGASRGFKAITVADYTFITNKDIPVAMLPAVSAANPTNVAYIDVKTAVPSVAYSVTVDGLTGTYTSTSSPTNGLIANDLAAALVTALGVGYTVSVLADTNIIKVVKAVGSITSVRASDKWSNTTLKVISNGLPLYSDLPSRFETGFTVEITGSADSTKDRYFVRWDGSKWVETIQPGLQYQLDKATMPHQLYQLPDNTWVFEQVPDWGDRQAGDEDTNPTPSFVGQPVRGLFFHRNRLGFLAADSAVLSRSGRYFEFWAKSATQVLDSDPIDLAASVDGVDTLDHALSFNTNLVIWSNTKQQFVLTGGDVLSPNNARLLPSTTFEADPATAPASLGNRAVFVEPSGEYCQLALYRVSQDTVTNKADPLTDHVPRLLPMSPRQVAVSTSWKGIVVVPDTADNTLHHMKYELDETDESLTQKSWARAFTFPSSSTVRFLKAHWDQRRLYLLIHYTTPGDVAGGRLAIEMMDFQANAVDTGLDHRLAVDRRLLLTGGYFDPELNRTTYTVPFYEATGAVFARCGAGREPYPLTPLSYTQGPGSATVVLQGDTTTQAIWAGRAYTDRYEFTEVILRDKDGVPIQAASTKLVSVLVRYVDSTRMYADVTPWLRETYSYPFSGREVGLPMHGAELLSLSTGSFKVPVGAKAEKTRVSIRRSGLLPVTLPYAEWVGDVTMKASR